MGEIMRLRVLNTVGATAKLKNTMLPIHTTNVSKYNHFTHCVIAVAAYQPRLHPPRRKTLVTNIVVHVGAAARTCSAAPE